MSLCRNKLKESLNTHDCQEEIPQESGHVWTPEEVLTMDHVTDSYLCSALENIYKIDFTRFKM